MAWRWWKRRRKWWWRRRWTRGRVRRRWPRRAGRRPRRRRVRRRRRWRRGRPRRRLYRFKRRLRRRRKKKKIIIKQWNPDTVKRCRIVGFMPAVICGQGSYNRNFTSHLEDRIAKGSYGGGHSTMRFSLRILFEEHQKHHNYWSYSNENLELALYYGARLKFYRDPETDFIVTYCRKSPMGGSIMTAPSLHPGNAMLSKRKILIPSLQTKPKGKKTVSVTIAPPTLFTHKWYFQKDICDITLFNLNAVAADLRFPFGSPQTDNVCITFQVLSSAYNESLSITEPANNEETFLDNFFKNAFPGTTERVFNVLNTYKTEGNYSHPQLKKFRPTATMPGDENYFYTPDGLWGDPVYSYQNSANNPTTQTRSKIIEILKKNMSTYFKKLEQELPSRKGNKCFTHLTGIFSSTYLNTGRIAPEFPGLYTDIIYNPWVDRGVGNRIWLDSLTKKNNMYTKGQSVCLLENMPLWTMLFGYVDWCKKELNNWSMPTIYRLVMVCPYTYPKLYHDTNPDYGFIPYSYTFGAGQMPDKSAYIPIEWRGKWYPHILHQEAVMEDIVKSGPFAPKVLKTNMQLNFKYKFLFNWGGSPISEQIVKDPCTQPTFQIPGGGDLPRRIQILDPKSLGPSFSFRSFDMRRHQFSSKSIKRIADQPSTSEYLFSGSKRPKIDLPKYEPPEESSSSRPQTRPWQSESEEESSQEQAPQEEKTIREQLQQQLQEQLQLRRGVECLFQQLIRTQQGVHVNPILT
nr:MAG: ORF1 [Torque teno virus]